MKLVPITVYSKNLASVVLRSSINEYQTNINWKCETIALLPFLFPKHLWENLSHIRKKKGGRDQLNPFLTCSPLQDSLLRDFLSQIFSMSCYFYTCKNLN